MSALGLPDDDVSPQAGLRRAVRMVEKEQRNALWAALLAGGTLAWYFYGAVPDGHMAMAGLVLAVLLAIHEQICALRIDAYKRELRSLTPRWPS